MPNKNYVKGRAFEYRVKNQFESDGYLVFRTAGSHSPADLIAFPKLGNWFSGKSLGYCPILIQCKNTTKPVNMTEFKNLKHVAELYGLSAIAITKLSGKITRILINDGGGLKI